MLGWVVDWFELEIYYVLHIPILLHQAEIGN